MIDILQVTQTKPGKEGPAESHIDRPLPGGDINAYSFEVAGWVLGRSVPAVAVDLICDDNLIRSIPVAVPRPDVAAHHPDVPHAKNCGFAATVSMLGLARQFDLALEAVFCDHARTTLGVIRGRHDPLRSEFQPRLQPLMLTSLGRTGSTWLMRLLSEHPGIVAYRSYPYELRASRYWMQMLVALAALPGRPPEPHNADISSADWWLHHSLCDVVHPSSPSDIHLWFRRAYPERIAAFCQRSTEDFYSQIAACQGQPQPRFFAEKHLPDTVPTLLWDLYPESREIILVRDFRAMMLSIQAFNAKRGTAGFGRHLVESEEDFVLFQGHQARRLLRSWKDRRDRTHLVRYEELIQQPSATISAILRYLGLEAAPSVVAGMIERASVDTPQFLEHRTSADAKASLDRWKDALAAALRPLCEIAFGDVLREFGYT